MKKTALSVALLSVLMVSSVHADDNARSPEQNEMLKAHGITPFEEVGGELVSIGKTALSFLTGGLSDIILGMFDVDDSPNSEFLNYDASNDSVPLSVNQDDTNFINIAWETYVNQTVLSAESTSDTMVKGMQGVGETVIADNNTNLIRQLAENKRENMGVPLGRSGMGCFAMEERNSVATVMVIKDDQTVRRAGMFNADMYQNAPIELGRYDETQIYFQDPTEIGISNDEYVKQLTAQFEQAQAQKAKGAKKASSSNNPYAQNNTPAPSGGGGNASRQATQANKGEAMAIYDPALYTMDNVAHNVDYGYIYSTKALPNDDPDSNYAVRDFIFRVMPTPIVVPENCEQSVCQSATNLNNAYTAFSSVISNAFQAQVQDRTLFDNARLEMIGKDLNLKMDIDGKLYGRGIGAENEIRENNPTKITVGGWDKANGGFYAGDDMAGEGGISSVPVDVPSGHPVDRMMKLAENNLIVSTSNQKGLSSGHNRRYSNGMWFGACLGNVARAYGFAFNNKVEQTFMYQSKTSYIEGNPPPLLNMHTGAERLIICNA